MSSPRVVVNQGILKQNIDAMQQEANRAGVTLRPHVKAHKCVEIAKLQIAAGAVGITVSKLGEAEVMAKLGRVDDIFVAYQLIGDDKYQRLASLRQSVTMSVAVDNIEHCRSLSAASTSERPLDVLIEVDTGLRRCGVVPGDVAGLAREICALPHLRLKGIFTHAGHVYGASAADVPRIGEDEARMMVACAEGLHRAGIVTSVISTGSTPTARHNLRIPGITEIRPGNYVFNDAIQLGLGVAEEGQCSLAVEATVISTPTPNRIVIDAGSKVFGLDKGAHGTAVVTGFGRVIDWPDLVIERLSEEHGVLSCGERQPKLGEKLRIIPNHACVVVNLTDRIWVEDIGHFWNVSARGQVD